MRLLGCGRCPGSCLATMIEWQTARIPGRRKAVALTIRVPLPERRTVSVDKGPGRNSLPLASLATSSTAHQGRRRSGISLSNLIGKSLFAISSNL